jgi:hypothetical protein
VHLVGVYRILSILKLHGTTNLKYIYAILISSALTRSKWARAYSYVSFFTCTKLLGASVVSELHFLSFLTSLRNRPEMRKSCTPRSLCCLPCIIFVYFLLIIDSPVLRSVYIQNTKRYNNSGSHKQENQTHFYFPIDLQNIFCHHYIMSDFISYVIVIFNIPKDIKTSFWISTTTISFSYIIYIRLPSRHDMTWDRYVTPFSYGMWLAVAMAACVLGVCLAITNFSKTRKQRLSIIETAFYILSCFCQQG